MMVLPAFWTARCSSSMSKGVVSVEVAEPGNPIELFEELVVFFQHYNVSQRRVSQP